MYCPACAFQVVKRAPACPRCGRALAAVLWDDAAGKETLAEHLPGDSLAGLFLDRRYRVEERLASGGMGEVFRGTDVQLDRPVAVKFLAKRLLGDPALAERFVRE